MNKKKQLPDGWRLSSLGEVADMVFGQSPPSAYYSGIPNGMPFFQGKADFGKDKPVPRVWCTKPIRIASPGDILLSIRAPVGPTIVTDIECCIGRGLCALRPKKKILHRDFLLFYLRAAESQLAAMGQGSTFHSIGKNALVAFHIPLPPVKEQRHIASLLDRQMATVEKARLAAEEKVAAARLLPSALLREVFTFSENDKLPDGWHWVELGDVLDYEQPTAYIVETAKYSPEYTMPVLTAGKTFLLGHTNETEGVFRNVPVIIFDDFTTASKYVDFPFKVKSSAMKILKPRNKQVNARFVFLCMQNILFDASSHRRYWISQYSKIKIPMPPPEIQRDIVAAYDRKLAAAETARLAAEEELRAISALPASLLREVFGVE